MKKTKYCPILLVASINIVFNITYYNQYLRMKGLD